MSTDRASLAADAKRLIGEYVEACETVATIHARNGLTIPPYEKRKAAAIALHAAIDALAANPAAEAPYAYAVHFPDQSRIDLVHDLEDLIDDMTNERHEVTPLYAQQAAEAPAAQPVALTALREILDAYHAGRLVPDSSASDGYVSSVIEQGEAALSASQQVEPQAGFEVRIAGPDDVVPFASELEALRHANAVNLTFRADLLKHPNDPVLCLATVHPANGAPNV